MAPSESTLPSPATGSAADKASAGRSSADDASVRSTSTRSELVEEVLAPVSEGVPCGADATYDDAFQLVKEKIDALSSFSGRIDQEKALGGGDESFVAAADASERPFAVIETASRQFLHETSKDLRVACYLVLALGHERGLAGAADGLAALRALVDAYGEKMHPARLRARCGALVFLFRRLSDLFGETEPAAKERSLLEDALKDLRALRAALVKEMGKEAPLTSSLEKTLEALLRRAPVPPPAPCEAVPISNGGSEARGDEEAHEDAQKARGKAPAGRQEGREDGGREALPLPEEALTAQQANQHLLRLATVMRQQDDARAAPYRMARALRWDALHALPPHDGKTRQTRIPVPPKQRRAYLLGLHEKKHHQRLVGDAEDSFHQPPFHFWLDLQRLLAQALDARGASHEAAALAVRRECALLLERFPELPRLSFRDGTPFARPVTRAWLETSARPTLGRSSGDQGVGSAGTGSARDPLDEQFHKARLELGAGNLPGALRLMEEAGTAPAASSQRVRFRRQLCRARLCLRAGRPAIARPIFEALSEEADRRGLSTWDPPLALDVWAGLYECLTALLEGNCPPNEQSRGVQNEQPLRSLKREGLEARAAHAFDRICEINPTHALSM